jgi:hypothetical protein
MEKQKLFNLNVIDAKSIYIEPTIPITKERIDKFHIGKIKFGDSKVINVGDKIDLTFASTITPYSTYYQANYIYKDNKGFRINEFETTKSSTYLLPLLGISKNMLLLETNFINCYISHFDYDNDLGDYLYLIYRYFPISYYSKFTKFLREQKGFLKYVKDWDKRLDCFIFSLDKETIKDVKLLIDGKYSKITEKSKKLILNFHNQNKTDEPLNQILYKGELRRNYLESAFGCKMPDNIDYDNKFDIDKESWKKQKNLSLD